MSSADVRNDLLGGIFRRISCRLMVWWTEKIKKVTNNDRGTRNTRCDRANGELQNVGIGKIAANAVLATAAMTAQEDPIREFRHLSPRLLAAIKRPPILS